MEPYYYGQMNKIQQSAYHSIKTGLTALEPSFSVPRLDGRELTDIFFKLRLDWPEIFYGVGFRYRFYQHAENVEMIPEYLFDKGKIKEHQKAMNARVSKLVRPALSMTELEKEQYIHDFICSSVRYDKLKKPYSHEIIGPLGQGVGVCEGIAKSVKILCDALGIWCIIAVSEANPDKNIKYRHAWNVVRIGGSYYQLDATFDNSLSHGGEVRYDYFNLDDKRFFRDHEPAMYELPQCSDGDHFYYKEKKLSFTKMEDVGKRAQQAVRKGKSLIFHWRGGHLTREVLSELLSIVEEAALKKEMHARISLNWPQAVMQVTFAGDHYGEQVVMEEANEGER
ncbi:transglutaminase domain-containing protein [Clostridium sp. AM58-1XD]|uniref:transglutaminase domain-containing protein n=1 Tax=Clostridium sp. AM58-1XD TaxID=2292307 RepID=UPI000E508138|nr:transglutaminase domain-containing protein [Clostridium sp. AM58-1XD]RGY98752.1 peptidase [Clostridium sp. AM58-1XD]